MTIKLEGTWERGLAFDVHTLSSTYLGCDENGRKRWNSKRSEMGELVYQLKYKNEKANISKICDLISKKIKGLETFDIIVPIPPTKYRTIQPVEELAKELGERERIRFINALEKISPGEEIKNISDPDERKKALKNTMKLTDNYNFSEKKILLLDDLYRSGVTARASNRDFIRGNECCKSMRTNNDKNTEQPMKTIFLSGSRAINRLNDEIRSRVRNIMNNEFRIILGDANGADKALQKFLLDCNYKNVVIFCAGNTCRNNLGNWDVHQVSVDPKLTGRSFYTQKDKEMAIRADYGLVMWDGKSAGSINNVFELLKKNKYAVVYFSPDKEFYNIKQLQDAKNLLKKCDEKSISTIKKKIRLDIVIRSLEAPVQQVLSF